MFTGIIERSSRVIGIADVKTFRRLTIANHWSDLAGGESIAINGVCLTVAEITSDEIGFDVVLETLNRTNLGLLDPGEDVHVERSLRIGDRLDGHFVQGHVDGVAQYVWQRGDDKEWRLRLSVPAQLARYLIPKGSVTVDGVSLTIAMVDGAEFEVALIPTTLQRTTLGRRSHHWLFNIECDVLSKTVISWLERTRGGG